MSSGKTFPIYVKTLTGSNTEIRVSPSDTILQVKQQLQSKLGLAAVRLLFNNKELADDSQKVSDAHIGEEAIVVLITETERPCHFLFALDESGSMTGGRWNALLQSFEEFVEKRLSASGKNDVPIQDRVSVFFHETHCRLAHCFKADGQTVPFDSIPLLELTPKSLVNNFHSGGNNFDHVIRFLEPYVHRCESEGFTPVLMFMTDGGDCGDDAPRDPNFRQRAYDRMAALKQAVPSLRLYVTVVFTTSEVDIDGAKKLCVAGGGDVENNYNFIEDDGSSNSYVPSSSPFTDLASYSMMPTSFDDDEDDAFAPKSLSMAAPMAAPLPAAAPTSHYSAVSTTSAQRKMASHWEKVYAVNSMQYAPPSL